MSLFAKKQNSLEKRLKRIEKELASVNSNIKSLKRKVPLETDVDSLRNRKVAEVSSDPAVTGSRSYNASPGPGSSPTTRKDPHDEKLADYLSGSFHSAGPLRHQRRIIRNRAIFMIIIVVFFLLCLIYNMFS